MNEQVNTARTSFERAVTFMRGGDPAMAERVCRQALREFPRDANLLTLLGATLIKQQKPDEAEKPLSRAVQLFPEFSRAFEGLAEVFILQGKLPAALEHLQRAARLEPDSASIKMKLARVLSGLGRDDDAGKAFEESFRLTPHREALVKGLGLQRMGNLREAERIYRDVLVEDPDDVDALRLLAGLAMRARQWGDAEVLLEKALSIAPDFFQGWMDLGLARQEQDRMDAALDALKRAMRLKPGEPGPYTSAGTVTAMSGRHDEALGYFESALERHPTNPGALAGTGHILKTIGRQSEAIESYRRCIEHNPGFGEAWWSLANLKTFRFDKDDVATMLGLVETDSLGDEPKTNLLFALGKAFEDQGDYANAFQWYEQGNALRREREAYDPVNTADTHDKLIEVFTPDFVAARSGNGCDSDAPLLIVGLPRSGSTLLEQILASHSRVEGTHELPELSRIARSTGGERYRGEAYPRSLLELDDADFRQLGEDYLSRTERHREMRAPRFTDKLPNNFAHVGFLHLILPNAPVIDARRHPLDSCVGTYKQLFARGQPFSYDLYEIGEFYLEYHRLMQHWHSVLPGKVLHVQYEDVVTDFEPQVRRLLEHCGLDFEEACLRFHETDRAVKTASSEQVRQPIYTASLQSWRRFEDQLGPLIEVLEPLLKELPKDWQPKSFL